MNWLNPLTWVLALHRKKPQPTQWCRVTQIVIVPPEGEYRIPPPYVLPVTVHIHPDLFEEEVEAALARQDVTCTWDFDAQTGTLRVNIPNVEKSWKVAQAIIQQLSAGLWPIPGRPTSRHPSA